MSRWQHARSAAVGGAVVVAVWAVIALTAPAQHPQEPAKLTFGNLPPALPNETEQFAPLVVPTGELQQAQLLQRVPGAPGQSPRPATNVQDPAYPVVTVRVRVPADALDGENIRYVLTVQNVSAADAHSVSLRNPLAPEAVEFVSAKPMPDDAKTDKQLIWNLGTLKAGKSQSVELTLRPKPGIKELKNLAYVRYEHGQAVTTKIGTPTVKVTKSAPKQAVRDEPYTVRVLVENQGKVPAEGVRVSENLPQSAEFEPITTGATRAPHNEGQQWRWDLGRMLPGERKIIEYRVTARGASEVFTLTNVTGSKLVADRPSEARTEVLVPGLEMKFTGPAGNEVVKPGESAKYEIVVRNTGTLPSTNIKVTGSIPVNCLPTSRTNGGTVYRDSVVWQVPRLEPKEAVSLRYAVKANTNGRWAFTARAADARGTRASQELMTTFQGTAALLWETHFTPLTVQVGKEGTFTVNVKNVGGEVAGKVRLMVDLPDNVDVTSSTPKGRTDNNTLQFEAESIPGNGERTYTLTFKGTKPDQALFKLRLTADCLGDRPMQTEKVVEIIGGAK
ncbi:DUF11 domain-containing protein [Gemmata sp. JC717]|uniref:DUF11 domain-containing protein n=1 Tax=Gemmata algarum TaxID=2975278 RepID=UPI0021BA845B|nr:DUF11 domain-containing protein [Gemmata algarum]MDY3551273.1 DUF11 domain-containing protein [Gemmata algarum]